MKKERFLSKTWFILLIVLFITPLGLFLMWKYEKFQKPWRITITIFFGLSFIGNVGNLLSPPPDKETGIVKQSETSEHNQYSATNTKTENPNDKKNNDKVIENNSVKQSEKQNTYLKPTWEKDIKIISSSNKTRTEKFDAVILLSQSTTLTDDEKISFVGDIVKDYINGNYLKDINNDEYMLNNIFKSYSIERAIDDRLSEPIDDFAFDFFQNSKYTYRKVDSVNSQAVKANELQMDRALSEFSSSTF